MIIINWAAINLSFKKKKSNVVRENTDNRKMQTSRILLTDCIALPK